MKANVAYSFTVINLFLITPMTHSALRIWIFIHKGHLLPS